MDIKDARTGQRVHFTHIALLERPQFAGRTYTVDKVNRVNVIIKGEDGRRVNVHPSFLEAGEAAPAGTATPTATVTPYDPHGIFNGEYVNPGTVAYVQEGTRGIPSGLYVVTGETSKGYRMSPLGGSTRYWRNVPRKGFDVINITDDVARDLRNALTQQVVSA